MEDWKELQIFNALFIETQEEWKTNDIYDYIENCEIVKLPFYNDSHQYGFSAIPWYNKWDKYQFALNKRQGFVRCKDINATVRDMTIIDWYKYYLVEDYDLVTESPVLYVYKECNWSYFDWCRTLPNRWCCQDWTNISGMTKYVKDWQEQFIQWRPTKSCLQKKFTKFYWPKGWVSRLTGKIRNELVWDKIISYFILTDSYTNPIVPWQYLYITKCNVWTSTTVYDIDPCGFVWQVGLSTTSVMNTALGEPNAVQIASNWIWLWWVNTQRQWNPYTQSFDNVNYNQENFWETWLVEVLVCKERWQTLWFITSDGAIALHDTESCWANIFEYIWATYQNSNWNTTSSSAYTSSMATWNNWLVTLNSLSKVTFFSNWQNFWYSWWEFSFTADGKFDQLLPVRDYLLLFWPKDIWFMYRRQTDTNSITWYNFWFTHAIEDEVWYLTNSSFINFRWKAYLVASNHKMYGINIKPSFTAQNWYADFEFWFDQQIHNYVNTDIESIYPEDWDEIYLSKNENQMRLFISNPNKVWTKILFFEDQYKIRHKWYICSINIYWEKEWCWYWRSWTRTNYWLTDEWANIRQKIWFHFWEYWASVFTPKQIELMKFGIWYNSNIWSKTTIKLSTDLGWWLQANKQWHLPTTEYVQNILKAQLSSDDNPERLRSYPIWFWLFSGNQIWFPNGKIYNTADDIDAFCLYENDRWQHELDCANNDIHPRIEWMPEEVNMEYREANFENTNYNQHNENYNWIPVNYWISKFAILAYPYTSIWDVFLFEWMADWEERIEFIWAQVLFHYKEPYDTRLENTITDKTLEIDSRIEQKHLYN